jgi:acetoin utilization deacetylase AcuC-like enzyme
MHRTNKIIRFYFFLSNIFVALPQSDFVLWVLMFAFYTDEFVLPLPESHRFPMEKYALLRSELAKTRKDIHFQVPRAATRSELALAHCPDYIAAVYEGTLSDTQQKDIGFPWSKAMVERSARSVGATIEAAFVAMRHGGAVNLAGGTHHAKYAKGGGFCVFNDQAVSARALQAHCLSQGLKEPQVLIIDLDVHQGDGTAQICAGDPSIFTFSIHGRSNYPFQKEASNLDIDLPDGTKDQDYLEALAQGLSEVSLEFTPDMVFYVAGHDVHQADRLGRLSLSDQGVCERNRMVFEFASKHRCPVVMTMAGGYFADLEHLVRLQVNTISEMAMWLELNFKAHINHSSDTLGNSLG